MSYIFSLLLWVAIWAMGLWLAVAVGQWATQSNWQRRAKARAFDALVEQHRRQA